MAKFSLARVPYYLYVIGFMGVGAFASFVKNSIATGHESDLHLLLMLAQALLAFWSLFYLWVAQTGADDEVGTEVAGMPVGKQYYYLGVLALGAWRAYLGYVLNHTGVGIQSVYGALWIVAALILLVFTYANYKSFQAKTATPPQPKGTWTNP